MAILTNILISSFILLLNVSNFFSFESTGPEAQRPKRIVGGDPVSIQNVPWQALIRQQISNHSSIQCGAVLIGPKWILTAAHCIREPLLRYPIQAYFGVTDVSAIFHRIHPMNPGRAISIRHVRHVYNPGHHDQQLSGDVVLLELNQTLEMNRNVRWIRLPEFGENFDYRIGSASGYGATGFPADQQSTIRLANRLHSVRVPILPQSSCTELYRKALKDGDKVAGWLRKNKFICAGQIAGRHDSCVGDSGGPLAVCVVPTDHWPRMVVNSHENLIIRYLLEHGHQNGGGGGGGPPSCPNGEWKLAGIISIGYRCAQPNMPGLYTDISHYSKWIHSIIDH